MITIGQNLGSLTTAMAPPRFAVTTFAGWMETNTTVRQLQSVLKAPSEICYLGRRSVLSGSGSTIIAIANLAFPHTGDPVACSLGYVAERLAVFIIAGAQSLEAALTTWLIPRHAAELQGAVESGKIVIWVRLMDADDERQAYHALFAAGCGSVGVHDLVIN